MKLSEIQQNMKTLRDYSFKDINGMDCSNQSLVDYDFSYSNLKNTNFKNSNLNRSIFRGAELTNSNFDGAGLCNVIGNGKEINNIIVGGFYVVFTDQVMAINEEKYPIKSWMDFNGQEIRDMGEDLFEFWVKYKEIIFQIIELSKQD